MAVVTGRVVQLYTNFSNVYVELDLPVEEQPLKGFFRVFYRGPDDPRYSALLLAASQGLEVEIRTSNPITPDQYGEVTIVAVRFDAPT